MVFNVHRVLSTVMELVPFTVECCCEICSHLHAPCLSRLQSAMEENDHANIRLFDSEGRMARPFIGCCFWSSTAEPRRPPSAIRLNRKLRLPRIDLRMPLVSYPITLRRNPLPNCMQVKPATAAAPPISIPDVMTAENNIHAGVKVLRDIADKYFNDPEIDPVNRLLFTFAAYNAGPTRIAELRKQASGHGLDPNKWFGNVELLASQSLGPVTVQYVSNIYKYYVAYKL